MIMHPLGVGEETNARRLEGMTHVIDFFRGLIEERRVERNPNAEDIVSAALDWKLDNEPIDDQELLNCLLGLFMAGIDTVASESSYAMLHLATHSEDRRRIVNEPEIIPPTVEELLRTYPILQTARKALHNTEFHDCRGKAADTAVFELALEP